MSTQNPSPPAGAKTLNLGEIFTHLEGGIAIVNQEIILRLTGQDAYILALACRAARPEVITDPLNPYASTLEAWGRTFTAAAIAAACLDNMPDREVRQAQARLTGLVSGLIY